MSNSRTQLGGGRFRIPEVSLRCPTPIGSNVKVICSHGSSNPGNRGDVQRKRLTAGKARCLNHNIFSPQSGMFYIALPFLHIIQIPSDSPALWFLTELQWKNNSTRHILPAMPCLVPRMRSWLQRTCANHQRD